VALFFLLIVHMPENIFAGPVAGTACCTTCCGGAAVMATAGGPAVFGGCFPACVGTMGMLFPCTFCAAAFAAPTP